MVITDWLDHSQWCSCLNKRQNHSPRRKQRIHTGWEWRAPNCKLNMTRSLVSGIKRTKDLIVEIFRWAQAWREYLITHQRAEDFILHFSLCEQLNAKQYPASGKWADEDGFITCKEKNPRRCWNIKHTVRAICVCHLKIMGTHTFMLSWFLTCSVFVLTGHL